MKSTDQFLSNSIDEDSFSQEVKEIISDFLDDNVSEKDIQIFLKLTSKIIEKEAKNLLNYYGKSRIPDEKRNKITNSNNKPYSINIFMIPSSPQSNNYNQPYQYVQQYTNPTTMQNTAYSQAQFYPQIPYLQQPAYSSISPANYPLPASIPKHSKKSKKEKSKKDKKSKKKDKKPKNTEKSSKPSKNGTTKFEHNPSSEFDGIINYLTKKTGGNIHKNGTIKITASSVNRHSFNNPDPENCVDLSNDSSGYKSSNDVLSWILFDFKERKIELESYSILSNSSNDFGQLRSWVIEVSNDESNWTKIDDHSNDSTLKKEKFIATFKVQKENEGFYRYIRLRQTGNSWHMNGSGKLINIPKIEFYGKLKE